MMTEDMKKLWNAYRLQRNPCRSGQKKDRNGDLVEFRLTFEEWLQIWVESGHLHERGCRKGKYVMARHGDVGHYELGNVAIKLHGENVSEALAGKVPWNKHKTQGPLSDEHRAKISAAQTGKKRGPYKKK